VTVDGNFARATKTPNPSVTVTCSKNVTSFIKFKEDFYHRLQSRLLFTGAL
jgi:hypothetical protein